MMEEEIEGSDLMNLVKIFKYGDLRGNLEDVVDSLM